MIVSEMFATGDISHGARLSASQIKCIDLLIMKDINGLSNDLIAKECGVDRSTLYRWQQKREFNNELIKRADEFNRSFLPSAYATLRGILTNGRTHEQLKAIELILKGQGKLKEVESTVINNNNTNDIGSIFDRLGV